MDKPLLNQNFMIAHVFDYLLKEFETVGLYTHNSKAKPTIQLFESHQAFK